MHWYLLRRLLLVPPLALVLSIVAFALVQAPAGSFLDSYVAALAIGGQAPDQTQIAALTHVYGLDQPIHIQYLKWIWNMFHGDLGISLEWQRPVTVLIGENLLLTVMLAAFAFTFTWLMAIPIGIISATRQYSVFDYVFTALSYIGVAIPNFLLALVIMWFAFAYFGVSVTGLFSPQFIEAPWSWARVVDMLKHVWLPMIILGAAGTARISRIMRANLLDELHKPYVVAARARGLPEWRLIFKYPVRLAFNPLVSTMGWYLPELFSGSLIVATVMSLPNIGPLLLRALISQDMYLAGSIILIYSVLTMVGTLISDISLALLDPRIRLGTA